jgi:hypothetical protein
MNSPCLSAGWVVGFEARANGRVMQGSVEVGQVIS